MLDSLKYINNVHINMNAREDQRPISLDPLEIDDFERMARMYLAMASRVRLSIIYLIRKYGEVCTQQLMKALSISQPSVTAHLNRLYRAGILTRTERKKFTFYRIDERAVNLLDPFLKYAKKLEEIKEG